DEQTGLHVRSGQELTHFKLHPGEEVRTPLVVLQFYQGDCIRAQNIWRRWMQAHNLPRPGGKLPEPILSSCSGGFFPGLMCNEADEKRFIDTFTAERIKLDYWWMDAGWYPCDGVGWPLTGTWKVDRKRFPNGIRAVTDHGHAKGLKHILWFEPERVHPGTELYEKHPQWLLGADGNQKLLNLGNVEARKWLTDHIDKMLTEEGIDLYRQDHNIDPLAFWRGNDSKDRQGITEIRYVEGYLAYWDELRRRHPDMLIDSCASGGRRNDLETLRRSLPMLRSDYHSFQGDSSFAAGNQGQTYGLALWVPFFGTGVYYNIKDHPVYVARSSFCPGFGYCRDVRKEGTDWDLIRRITGDWRKISTFFSGDYYPLTKYGLADDQWIAWQFHRADLDGGVVQAFRRPGSVYESARLKLHGLNPEAKYTLMNLDSPEKTKATGRQLMEEGLLIIAKQCPSAPIVIYQREK
ncbi:MAG: alpha-galactosidase, partial [Pirellulales bacterium]|nr:alpha-galactosidase [Pirellulales bacterium]